MQVAARFTAGCLWHLPHAGLCVVVAAGNGHDFATVGFAAFVGSVTSYSNHVGMSEKVRRLALGTGLASLCAFAACIYASASQPRPHPCPGVAVVQRDVHAQGCAVSLSHPRRYAYREKAGAALLGDSSCERKPHFFTSSLLPFCPPTAAQYDMAVDDVLNRIYNNPRTCSIHLGVGSISENQFRLVEYSHEEVRQLLSSAAVLGEGSLHRVHGPLWLQPATPDPAPQVFVYDDQNFPAYLPEHPQLDGVRCRDKSLTSRRRLPCRVPHIHPPLSPLPFHSLSTSTSTCSLPSMFRFVHSSASFA